MQTLKPMVFVLVAVALLLGLAALTQAGELQVVQATQYSSSFFYAVIWATNTSEVAAVQLLVNGEPVVPSQESRSDFPGYGSAWRIFVYAPVVKKGDQLTAVLVDNPSEDEMVARCISKGGKAYCNSGF